MDIEEQNHEDWKKFIQINVYGRTLKELQQNGVDLKYLLKEIGCSKYYITEQSMYSGDSDSGVDSSFEDTIPMFSNTVATTKYPRCSTPVASKFYSKMTLCPSKIISRISENLEEACFDANEFEKDQNCENLGNPSILRKSAHEDDIQKLIDDMIYEVEKNCWENVNFEKQLMPDVEMGHLDENYDKRRPNLLVGEEISGVTNERRSFHASAAEKKVYTVEKVIANEEKPNLLKRARTEIDSRKKNEVQLTRSNTAHPLPVITPILVSRRLKKTVSEVKKERRRATELTRSKTAHPLTGFNQVVITPAPTTTQPAVQPFTSRQMSTKSEKTYCDLTPVFSDPEFLENSDQERYENQTAENVEENIFHRIVNDQEGVEQDLTFRMNIDYENDYSGYGEWTTPEESFAERENSANDTVVVPTGFESENSVVTVLDAGTVPRPILVRKTTKYRSKEPKTDKKVSFDCQHIPNVQAMSPAEYKNFINVSRFIKCQFPNCQNEYKWKIKYGKMRLVDHALSHVDSRVISCQHCDKTTKTVRQMRYHNQKVHGNNRVTGYGMKRLKAEEEKVKKIWRLCYKSHIPIIGDISTQTNHVRLNRKERTIRKKAAKKGTAADINFSRIQ